MGLLSAGNSILEKVNASVIEGFTFSDLIKKHKIEICFVLRPIGEFYFCSNSIGLDGISILQTYSSKAFWDGLNLKTETIQNYSVQENSIGQFLQFFSASQKDIVTFVSIYKSRSDEIFILINKCLSTQIIIDYNNIKPQQLHSFKAETDLFSRGYIANKILIDFSEALEGFCNSFNKDKKLYSIFINALENEFHNRLSFFISAPDFVKKTDHNSAVLIKFSKNELSSDLFLTHIIKVFSSFLGDFAQLISVYVEDRLNDSQKFEALFQVN